MFKKYKERKAALAEARRKLMEEKMEEAVIRVQLLLIPLQLDSLITQNIQQNIQQNQNEIFEQIAQQNIQQIMQQNIQQHTHIM